MHEQVKKNRWLIALSAVAIHLSIGSAYAYSVYKNPLSKQLGWDGTQVAFSFTIAIFFLGISAAFFGPFVEKHGPRKSAMLAAVLFSLGQVGTGLAVSLGSLTLFYLFYGVIGGMGLGLGYISPVSTLIKWFPDRRGMATGMAVFGFGAGSLLTSPIAANLLQSIGISNTFYTLGLIYFILMMSGALYITRPPEGYMSSFQTKTGKIKQDLAQLTAKEAIRTKRFWMLWLMMFINISAGIMLISVASPMGQEKVGMAAIQAAAMVGIMGIFNGGGRIGWATISDYLGRTNVFTIFFILQLIAFLILPEVTTALLFQVLILVIMTTYGGGFAVLPAFIGDIFGTKQLGAIHGYILTAWSMAGIAGPMVVAYIRDQTNSYDLTFYVVAGMILVAFITSILIRADIKNIRKLSAPVDIEKAVS